MKNMLEGAVIFQNGLLLKQKIINSEKYVSGAEDLQGSNTLTTNRE